MDDLLLFLINKYKGNWDKIYNAIINKISINLQTLKKTEIKLSTNEQIMLINHDNYPIKLRNVYMPPFSLFYNGDLGLLDQKVLSIVGKINLKRDINQIIDISKQNICICIKNDDISQELIKEFSYNNLKLIVLCEGSIENFKYNDYKYKNLLLVSEYWNSNEYTKSKEQTIDRLLYSFANKIYMKKFNPKPINYLINTYNDLPIKIYCSYNEKETKRYNLKYSENQLSFIKSINEINFYDL